MRETSPRTTRPSASMLEQVEAHAGEQHLRVDEAGDQVEQRVRRGGGRSSASAGSAPRRAGTSGSRAGGRASASQRSASAAAVGGRATTASAPSRRTRASSGDRARARLTRRCGPCSLRPRRGHQPRRPRLCTSARRYGAPRHSGIAAVASATSRVEVADRARAGRARARCSGDRARRRGRPACRASRRRRRRRGCRRPPGRPRRAARRAPASGAASAPAACAPAIVAAANSAPVLARW